MRKKDKEILLDLLNRSRIFVRSLERDYNPTDMQINDLFYAPLSNIYDMYVFHVMLCNKLETILYERL